MHYDDTINSSCNMNEWATCAVWTALQAHHIPSPTEEIFTEISKDFTIRWNITLKGQMQSTSESIARRTSLANILTTNSAIPLLCRLLWMQILNL
jgi:hypothetical protein